MPQEGKVGVEAPLVFVSKASEDGIVAMRAVTLLRRAGLRAWISDEDIPDGGYHALEVPRAINRSRALLVLVSEEAVASEWVIREVDAAVSASVPVFPVALPGFRGVESLPEDWQFLLKRAQVRADGDLEAVVASIRKGLIGPGPNSAVALGLTPGPAQPDPYRFPDVSAVRLPLRVASVAARGFVGQDRHEEVSELLRAWEQVTTSGSARVVVLLAETGFGKTRIVQEFYRGLAAAQPEPPFWPADIVDASTSGHGALRESRKRVAPLDLAPANGARADYLWLGHVVDEGHGGRVDVGLVHLAEDLGRALGLAAEAQPDGTGARMVTQALGIDPIPGTDTRLAVTELLHRGATVDRQPVSSGSVEAFWQGARALWADPDLAIPAVIVVEDGHFAGQETISALEQLATSTGLPFLIVVCAQESQLGSRTADGDGVPGRSRRPLGQLVDQNLPSVTVRRLARLPDPDVRILFREAIPDLDAETVAAAVRKVDGNPYHAHTLLTEMVKAAEQGRLDVGWVRRRPGTFEGELRQQWSVLPDEVRRLLSGIAVLGTQVPERIGMHAMRAVYGSDPEAAVDASLQTGWLRRLATDEALRFLERPRWVIANSESVEEWHPAQRRQIIEEALGTLESLATDSSGLGDPLLQELHLALALTADREGIPFDRVAAVRSGLAGSLRLRLATDDAGCLAVAQETESLVAGHATDPGMSVIAVESALALKIGLGNSLPHGGTAARTVAAAELAVQRVQAVADRRPDLAARAYAALCRVNRVLLDVARQRVAAEALEQADEWLARAPAPDAQTRAEVMHARALVAKAQGNNLAAAEFSGRRLEQLQGAYGPLDRRVVTALLNSAFYWNRVDIERALGLKEDLLDRRMRIWGDRSTASVAFAEKELAFALIHLPGQDRLDEAYGLATHALGTLARTRGEFANGTMLARGVWCVVVSRVSDGLETSGATQEAFDLRTQGLVAACENLENTRRGAPLSTMVKRRRRVAELQVRLGDPEGIDTLREILQTETSNRLEGSSEAGEDIEVLWTVAELAAGLCRLGREEESVAVAAQYPIEREDRWPAFQPRGWRSTRPEDVRTGVL